MTTNTIEQLRADLKFRTSLRGQSLDFYSTWGLFSPREVDEGSRLLLDHIQVAPNADCLDLGCGYGVIGLTLARLAPGGHTTLVDKDFVAIDYCRKNIALNHIDNADACLSNGLDAIRERRFDLIASNIPAKVGNELMTLFFYDAERQLRPGGQLYVVTINGLREYIKRVFKERFGNYTKLKQGRNYTVALATVS